MGTARPTTRRTDRPIRGSFPRTGRSFFVCLALVAGCKSNNRYDGIEAELRTRNRELAEARSELEQYKLTAGAYQQGATCGLPGQGGEPRGPVPQFIREIRIGSGSGGLDADGKPGDEALQVVVVPSDDEGSAVKVPGRVAVTAFEVNRAGLKTPIGQWDVPPDVLKRHWKSGLLTTGYVLVLQWDRPPTTDRVRVVVRLTTTDGRSFEADKDVPVSPLPGLAPTPRPGGIEELPPPALVPENPKKQAARLGPALAG
jgi:hypothetical protein